MLVVAVTVAVVLMLAASAHADTIGHCGYAEPSASTLTSGGHTWSLEGRDDFNKPAPVGSFASSTYGKTVYTGDQGLSWSEYPDGWRATFTGSTEGYQPSTVQSVHDGVLDFYLHTDSAGNPVGANPSPQPGGQLYQTYGRYAVCEKVVPSDAHDLNDFVQAFLLWPESDSNWQYAESDYPNAFLDQAGTNAYAHYGGAGAQDYFTTGTTNMGLWNKFVEDWGPGFRSYYVNGRLIGTSTNQVWSGPERWQFQIEPDGDDGDGGHVYIDWAAEWKYAS